MSPTLDEINGNFGINIKDWRRKKKNNQTLQKKRGCFGVRINISSLEERIVFGFTRKGGCKSYLFSGAAGLGQIRP